MASSTQTLEILIQGKDQGALGLATTLGEKIDALGLRGMKAADALAILRDKTAELSAAGASASGAMDTLGKRTAGVETGASAATLAYRALSGILATVGITAVTRDFLDANIQFERTNLTLKAVTGSTADAAREMDFVRAVANKLGLEVGATATQYSQLIAASKGTALEGQTTRDIFEKVTTAMAVLGKSSADTGGVLNALTQIISKGTVQAEELKGQIGDRLPGALQIAAKAMGVTTGELQALMKDGLVPASTFLPKFADELAKTFGASGPIDTYQAQVARFKNELEKLYVTVGQAGVIDFLANQFKSLSTGTSLFTIGMTNAKDSFRDLGAFLAGDVSLADLYDKLVRNNKAADQARVGLNALAGTYETTAESARLLRQQQEALANVAASNQTDAETARLIRQNGVLAEAAVNTAKVGDALKALGVSKGLRGEIDAIAAALKDLFSNPATTGAQALTGFEAALKKVKTNGDINAIGIELTDAFAKGTISQEVFNRGVGELIKTQSALDKGLKASSDSLDKQKQAAERATKAADDYRLKMEELASNERIKLIEARVSLSIANVEANAKIAVAAFESINATINSTGTSLTDLFKLFAQGGLGSSVDLKLRQQIDLENKRRDEALSLQKRMTEAQIAYIQSQTKALNQGDALIKIDGAGLQPHLEAFMWEILRTIQTKVNSQGLDFLLGMPGI